MKLMPICLRKGRRLMWIALVLLLLFVVMPGLLFVLNGTIFASGEKPISGFTNHPPAPETNNVRILAYNVAKGFVRTGRFSFEDESAVRERMRRIADVINREKPDFVFLEEVMHECTPCPVNQVEELAQMTGMHQWVFGENYNFGLPFYRVVGGNAILSRRPLEPVTNASLAGRRPFYVTHNNRRVLWCRAQIHGQAVLLAVLHTDSFSRTNNATQMQQILDYAGDQPTILAGDFNATPDSQTLKLVQQSGKFAGAVEGDLTFPTEKPDRRIDYVFAPVNWKLLEHRVLSDDASDHLPIVSTYEIP